MRGVTRVGGASMFSASAAARTTFEMERCKRVQRGAVLCCGWFMVNVCRSKQARRSSLRLMGVNLLLESVKEFYGRSTYVLLK